MFDIIAACSDTLGIGINNSLPWHFPEELALFKEKTMNSVLIVGRKTVENLPKLPGRIIICVSAKGIVSADSKNPTVIANSLSKALAFCENAFPDKKVFIAGGAQIYKEALSRNNISKIGKLHISWIEGEFICDSYFPMIGLHDWVIEKEYRGTGFVHTELVYRDKGENQYLALINDVCSYGDKRITRNGETKSLFVKTLEFDLRKGFPLLTTKKMFFKAIIEELLFFIRGDTDTKILEDKGIRIWAGNTNRKFLDSLGKQDRDEGVMGPMYGYQWRYFDAPYDEKTKGPQNYGVDQLQNVVNLIRKDPNSRRIIMTSYNPRMADEGVLYPCHSLMLQFYVVNNRLDLFCFNRSQDCMLGVPFNIASSALLLFLIAKITNLEPGILHLTLGDVHVYASHYDAVVQQIMRRPYTFPTLILATPVHEISDLEKLSWQDFRMDDYRCHTSIKLDMVP